jgi:hypothetical protein
MLIVPGNTSKTFRSGELDEETRYFSGSTGSSSALIAEGMNNNPLGVLHIVKGFSV